MFSILIRIRVGPTWYAGSSGGVILETRTYFATSPFHYTSMMELFAIGALDFDLTFYAYLDPVAYRNSAQSTPKIHIAPSIANAKLSCKSNFMRWTKLSLSDSLKSSSYRWKTRTTQARYLRCLRLRKQIWDQIRYGSDQTTFESIERSRKFFLFFR